MLRAKLEAVSKVEDVSAQTPTRPAQVRREFFIDNLMVRIHFIIVKIRRTLFSR